MRWTWPLAYSPRVLPDAPGQFGAVRKHDVHTGVDLYAEPGTPVHAVEDGLIVSIEDFTGPSAGSPWWLETKAILVEGASGVVCYGELDVAEDIRVGMMVPRAARLGAVLPVLRKFKGRPTTMLHLELYERGTRASVIWNLGEERPAGLLDPTSRLLDAKEAST
jgi:murein DD-endopeptidase MepM/ murein hydrolase activator NlpD